MTDTNEATKETAETDEIIGDLFSIPAVFMNRIMIVSVGVGVYRFIIAEDVKKADKIHSYPRGAFIVHIDSLRLIKQISEQGIKLYEAQTTLTSDTMQ